jgi:hypothetical protein
VESHKHLLVAISELKLQRVLQQLAQQLLVLRVGELQQEPLQQGPLQQGPP